MKPLIPALTCAALLLATPTHADTHYVSKTGSNTPPYTSWATATDAIQQAIDAAEAGDTVLVGPGRFTGFGNRDLDFAGRSLVLKSALGPESTIVDCEATFGDPHRGVYFHSGEDSTAVVDGFTVTGGYATDAMEWNRGGAIFCLRSSPRISNCRLVDNVSYYRGGALFAYEASPIVENCLIRRNQGWDGGGLGGNTCGMIVRACLIDSNVALNDGGGVWFGRSGGTVVEECVIASNRAENTGGGGHVRADPSLGFAHCTIVDNSSPSGQGIYCHAASPTFETTVIAFNQGVAFECSSELPGNPEFNCSDIFGNPSGDWIGCIAGQAGTNGNISADPQFCAPEFGNFHLSSASLCLPDNNTCGVLIGALGAGCSSDSLPGDVNCDGWLDLSDVVLLGNALDGVADLTGTCGEGSADVNADGLVNENDYHLLYDVVSGLEP